MMGRRLFVSAQIAWALITAAVFDATMLQGEIWRLVKYQTATSVVVIETSAKTFWDRLRSDERVAQALPSVARAQTDQDQKR